MAYAAFRLGLYLARVLVVALLIAPVVAWWWVIVLDAVLTGGGLAQIGAHLQALGAAASDPAGVAIVRDLWLMMALVVALVYPVVRPPSVLRGTGAAQGQGEP